MNDNSTIFNSDLALTAVTLSAQVYKNAKGLGAEGLLKKLGYDDSDFANIDCSFARPGVCFGYKQIEEGKNLFAVVVRGTDNTDDLFDIWTDLQDGSMSMFRTSCQNICRELGKYMRRVTGKLKETLLEEENYFFFCGHSLGGGCS